MDLLLFVDLGEKTEVGIKNPSQRGFRLSDSARWIWREPVIRQLRARTLRWSCIRCCPNRLSPDREDGVPFQLRSHSPECRNHSLPDAPPVLGTAEHPHRLAADIHLEKKRFALTVFMRSVL